MKDGMNPENKIEKTNVDMSREQLKDRNTELGRVLEEEQEKATMGVSATGGDLDSDVYQAEVVGEEAVGGLTSTPGQNDVDKLGHAVGVEFPDREEIGIRNKLEERDANRLERELEAKR